MVQEVSGRVASQPGSQPSASAAVASSPVGADPSRGDWIEWSGGDCPLPRYVEVRYRDGTEQRLLIGSISDHNDWKHIDSDPSGDIVAYRLVSA